ncbi:hypothetical protein BJV77DRAFT_958234 [Russula vinacea]|nr:hypothetical protein BJV77DRAFT_958234 [Russula vinacea]
MPDVFEKIPRSATSDMPLGYWLLRALRAAILVKKEMPAEYSCLKGLVCLGLARVRVGDDAALMAVPVGNERPQVPGNGSSEHAGHKMCVRRASGWTLHGVKPTSKDTILYITIDRNVHPYSSISGVRWHLETCGVGLLSLATQLITEADLKVEYISTRTVRRAATAFVIVEWLRQAAADPL